METESSHGPLASRLNAATILRLRQALPQLQRWILKYTESAAAQAVCVASLCVRDLARCYPAELLGIARVSLVDEICYPPLDRFGLPEFKDLQETTWSGITYGDIYFLRRDVACPALHFHELVHVVQYRRLGFERFLWAYCVGLSLQRYEESPLEKMAYDLQLEFEHGIYRRTLVSDIEQRTDVIGRDAYAWADGS